MDPLLTTTYSCSVWILCGANSISSSFSISYPCCINIIAYYFSYFTFCCLQVALVVEEHLLNRVAPAQAVRGGLAHVDADLGHSVSIVNEDKSDDN